jgi:hypothetical protein
MSPLTFLILTALLLLAMTGGVAGILLELRRETARAAWRNPAIRDALLPIAGWGSLFALDFSVTLAGEDRLPVGVKHLLGTLAVLLLAKSCLYCLHPCAHRHPSAGVTFERRRPAKRLDSLSPFFTGRGLG